MITKYKTSHMMSPKIERVEALRETKLSVFIRGHYGEEQREAKKSNFVEYHDTWDSAHKSLKEHAEIRVKVAEQTLDSAKRKLKLIQDMKEPQ